METPMPIPRHYTPTAEDRAAIAQWRRTALTVYGAIALACLSGVSASRYLSSATASTSAALAISEPMTVEPAPTPVAEAAKSQSRAPLQSASAAGAAEMLAENAWDFNRPETIPGFGPMTPTAPRHAEHEQLPGSVSAADERPGVDIRALLADPAIRAQTGLAENHWDFNDPDSIPGFGSMPSADQTRRVAGTPAQATEW
jgi:hypothetical protein